MGWVECKVLTIWVAKRGNAPPAADRRNVCAAMADADLVESLGFSFIHQDNKIIG